MLGGGGGGGDGHARASLADDDAPIALDKVVIKCILFPLLAILLTGVPSQAEIGVDLEVTSPNEGMRVRSLGGMRQRQPVQVRACACVCVRVLIGTSRQIIADDDMPEGALTEPTPLPTKASDALGAIDLSTPLRSDELLKNATHRIASAPGAAAAAAAATATGAAARGARGGARGGTRGSGVRGAAVRGARGAPRGARGAGSVRGGGVARTTSTSSTESTGAPGAAAAAAAASASASPTPALSTLAPLPTPSGAAIPLASDDMLALSYVLRTNAKEASKIQLVWRVACTGVGGVTNLEVRDHAVSLALVCDRGLALGVDR
jgi:hypothetical protein